MKIETQFLEDHQVKLKVEVDPEPLEAAKRRAARQIAQRTKIPGFRPGKAPFNVVERFVGAPVVLQDALDLLVNEIYPKAIEESGIKPYGMGKLESISSTEPPIFEFIVPLEAEVKLGDYRSLRLPYEPKDISDEEIEKVLNDLREQQAIIEPVDRPSQEGDQVTVRLSAERKPDDAGNKVTLIRERSLPFIIRAETDSKEDSHGAEWPFEGFSNHLVGLSAGEEKNLTFTFPEDSSFAAWRGEEADFHIVVENVKSRTLPDLDDEFAGSQGEYENLATFRSDVRTRLEGKSQQVYDSEYEEKVLDKLVEETSFKYPPQMVEEEVDVLVRRLESQLARQKMDMDLYLKTRQMDMEALRKEFSPTAESRLKRYLVIYEIAELEKINVSKEEIENETSRTLNQLYAASDTTKMRKGLSTKSISNLSNSITVDLLVQHTLEHVRAIARGDISSGDEAPAEHPSETSTEVLLPSKEATLETGMETAIPDTTLVAESPLNIGEIPPSGEQVSPEKPKTTKKSRRKNA